MRCKNCNIPTTYDYAEHVSLCGLFGWDNNDEHFCEFANGDEGCIHRKSTLEKWWKEWDEVGRQKESDFIAKQMEDYVKFFKKESEDK